ncbi:hypothetical protein P692DRAFT_20835959 [Suillus brevipes Sb2]|nr:hypothetical protein P692DRAFT_20835959 [Suillus brevipes Sb2]
MNDMHAYLQRAPAPDALSTHRSVFGTDHYMFAVLPNSAFTPSQHISFRRLSTFDLLPKYVDYTGLVTAPKNSHLEGMFS